MRLKSNYWLYFASLEFPKCCLNRVWQISKVYNSEIAKTSRKNPFSKPYKAFLNRLYFERNIRIRFIYYKISSCRPSKIVDMRERQMLSTCRLWSLYQGSWGAIPKMDTNDLFAFHNLVVLNCRIYFLGANMITCIKNKPCNKTLITIGQYTDVFLVEACGNKS